MVGLQRPESNIGVQVQICLRIAGLHVTFTLIAKSTRLERGPATPHHRRARLTTQQGGSFTLQPVSGSSSKAMYLGLLFKEGMIWYAICICVCYHLSAFVYGIEVSKGRGQECIYLPS